MSVSKKENIFILHSLNGDTLNIWGQDIKENFNKQNIEVILPQFPIRADSSYEKFRDILIEYLNNDSLNENSIVICHSIGNAYFIRFCKEMEYIPKAYIAVAPGAVYNIPSNRDDYTVKVKAQAYCKQEQLDFIKNKIKNKYCFYSDESEPKEKMFKKFIEDTNSEGIYLKYYNHFDGYHRIYKIPELTKLINEILKNKLEEYKMFNVNHVAISVIDNKETIEFYKKFGFKEFKKWKAEDESIKIDMLKLNDTVLEIFCYKEYTKLPETAKSIATDLPVIGTKHFALGVENIDQAKEFVIKNEIAKDIEIKVGRLGKPYFFIKDPNGILVEIIENS